MSTRGAAGDASWWWVRGGHQVRRDFVFRGGMVFNQTAHTRFQLPMARQVTSPPAPSYHHQQGSRPFHQQNGGNYFGKPNVQIPLSKPRLRWSKELHEKFVSAVNELGGASNATPKTIWNIMRVEGITLFQIKSHLQKYRLGKIPGRLRRDALPAHGRRHAEDEMQNHPMDREGYQSFSDLSNMKMKIDEALKAPKYGNLNHESHAVVKKSENPQPILSSGNHGDSHFPEWYELLYGEDIVSHRNSSTDDYKSSLGYSSRLNSSISNMTFGSFFDEVERFAKIEEELMKDDVVAMDAPTQLNNNAYLYRGLI